MEQDVQDALGTLRALPQLWEWLVEPLEPALIDREIDGGTITDDLAVAAAALGVEVADSDRFANILSAYHRQVGVTNADARREAIPGDRIIASAEAGERSLQRAGRRVVAAGAGAPHTRGVIERVNVSDGGVPKRAVDEADVTARGLTADRQESRRHHGRPFQALCLWSTEVIDRLAAEGHPISPGAAGENITVSGLDWPSLRPGTRLRVGEVLAEISAYAAPCEKNAQWFLEGDFDRMAHEREPGVSRLYAWVHEGGKVRPGDEVVVEP